MFCGRLQKIHNIKNQYKTLTSLTQNFDILQKQCRIMVLEINILFDSINDISNKCDIILKKLNIKEAEIKKEGLKSLQKKRRGPPYYKKGRFYL